MRFVDEGLDEAFRRDGFVLADFLDAAELTAARAIPERVGPAPGDPRSGFFPGINSQTAEWKRAVVDLALPIVERPLAALVADAHVYFTTLLVKWPTPDGRFPPHQDPTMVADEVARPGMTLWIPLQDIAVDGPDSGVIRLTPGSQRLRTGDRAGGRGYNPEEFAGVADALAAHGRAVPVRAGAALALDHRVVHWSEPNLTDGPRWVLAVSLRSADVTNVHVAIEGGVVEVFAVDDDYYYGDRTTATTRARYPLLDRRPADPSPPLTSADVAAIAVGTPAHSRQPPSRSGSTSTGAERRVLIDAGAERRLRRDGFVKISLLDRAAAAELRDAYGRLHGWSGEGFEVDFGVDDPGYRRAASDELASVVDTALDATFVDHVPFLRNYLVKWPGTPPHLSFPQCPHRDWAYTDERDGVRSWSVWIALEDIEGDNGQLQVSRGSHRLDDMIRGTNIKAPWIEHDDVWPSRLVTVPARAGEAIVLDARVIHCSLPNHGDRPRVAASVAVRPRGAALVHFRRHDATLAARYDVDEEFFLTQSAAELVESGPAWAPSGYVEIGGRDYSPRSLAMRLDLQPLSLLDHAHRVLRDRRRAPEPRGTRSTRGARSTGSVSTPLVRRAPVETSGLATTDDLPWVASVEECWTDIRDEVARYLAAETPPLIEDVTGVHQGNVGAWRTLVLQHPDLPAPDVLVQFPATAAALDRIPSLVSGGFSLLEPGTHIPEHCGPDPSILRYHLGLIVPGGDGACRLRVGDEVVAEREGSSLLFDDSLPHEAWNDSAGDRVVLVVDVLKPADDG